MVQPPNPLVGSELALAAPLLENGPDLGLELTFLRLFHTLWLKFLFPAKKPSFLLPPIQVPLIQVHFCVLLPAKKPSSYNAFVISV